MDAVNAVGVGANRSTDTVYSKNNCWGSLYPLRSGDAVDTVGVGAKRSTHTVHSANMGGGDHYLECKKVNPHSGDAVGAQCMH